MANDTYENTYTKIIEPLYGKIRDNNNDNELLKTNICPHDFWIYSREDFTKYETYSIDPDGCEDADDAFSIYVENEKLYLAIHIADPTEYINIKSDLWKDMIERVVTRYPSNRKPVHMMPEKIMAKASLMDNEYGNIKMAITILTEIDRFSFEPIGNVKLLFTKIRVKKENAFSYLQAAKHFWSNDLLYNGIRISEALKRRRSEKTRGVVLSEVSNSYPKYSTNKPPYLYIDSVSERLTKQMISEFAIFANSFVGEYLKINFEGKGIFRSCNAKEWLNEVYPDISGQELLNEIIINGIKAEYVSTFESHDLVGAPEYCHFTSPIRRLSDCVCHYLLKYIHFKNKNIDTIIPFSNDELSIISNKCLVVSKAMKQIQYKDIKFRLIHVMNNMLLCDNNLMLQYFITGYTGLFLNIIIFKLGDHNVHMSYTLRVKNHNYVHDPKHLYCVLISKVKCFEKFDNGTIPELDKQILDI